MPLAGETNTDWLDSKFRAFLDHTFAEELARRTEDASQLGLPGHYAEWDDHSNKAYDVEYQQAKEALDHLHNAFQLNRLSAENQLNYKLFEYRMQQRVDMYPFRYQRYPIIHHEGIQTQLPALLIEYQQIHSEEDAQAYLSRLRGLSKVIQQLIEAAETRAQRGYFAPRFTYQKVAEGCRQVISGIPIDAGPQENALYADFRAKVIAWVSMKSID